MEIHLDVHTHLLREYPDETCLAFTNMAAEAVGLGASVLTFVGLAGTILQGCVSLRSILDDVKDAPTDLRALKRELAIFESYLDGFQSHPVVEGCPGGA